MPELPEVETVVLGLRPRLVGRRISRLEVHQPPRYGVVRQPVAGFRRTLVGARIAGVRRRGKYILLELDPPANGRPRRVWIVHLGMTGQLYACRPDAPRLKHTHVIAWLDSGEQLRYRDPRRFGKMLTLPAADLEDYFRRLGPEPFQLSLEGFRQIFSGRHAPVRNLLLNQARLGGLGNIYANEALFVAGIHPAVPGGRLKREELERLFQALQTVLREAIAGQGSSVSDYRTADGLPGDYQNYLRVYDREGEPCPGCGRAVGRLVLAGRSAFYCPGCQPRSRLRGTTGLRSRGQAKRRSSLRPIKKNRAAKPLPRGA